MKISATSEICKGRTSSPMFFIVLGRWGMVNLACTQEECWPFCFRVTLLLFFGSSGGAPEAFEVALRTLLSICLLAIT